MNPETETVEAMQPPPQLDDSAFWTTGPEGELVVIADAGHMSFVEQPEQYLRAVRRFLGGVAAAA